MAEDWEPNKQYIFESKEYEKKYQSILYTAVSGAKRTIKSSLVPYSEGTNESEKLWAFWLLPLLCTGPEDGGKGSKYTILHCTGCTTCNYSTGAFQK